MQNYGFTWGFVWVWKVVSRTKREKQIDVSEQGAEETTWA